MLFRILHRAAQRPFASAVLAACLVFLTIAAVWLYAHEGHQALPSRGAQIDPENPNRILVKPEARTALDVQTAKVVERALDERIVAPATLVAPWQQYAFATSRLGGRVAAVHVQPGQTVKRGQVLAEVQSLELENLQLELLDAQNDVRLSGNNLIEVENDRQGAVTGQFLAETRARHQENLNTLDLIRRKVLGLGVAEADLDRLLRDRTARPLRTLPVKCPLDGVVLHVAVQVGQVIEPVQHLFEVVDQSRVWVKIGLLERDLPRVETGQPVEVRLAAYPENLFRSTVQVKGLALDGQTHQGVVWAELAGLPEAQRLLPGMFGQAAIVLLARAQTLAVPPDAVLRDGAERFVFVETGPGQYERQNVVLGRHTHEWVEIRPGRVVSGDRVVTVGGAQLASLFHAEVLLSPEATQFAGLRTEPVQRRSVAKVTTLQGEVELPPDRRAVASARLSGTVQRILVERDQAVRAGDVIAEVASLELHNLQLELLRNHFKVALLEQTLERLRPLAEQSSLAVSRRQFREAQSAHSAALLRRDHLQLKLESVGLSAQQIRDVLQTQQVIEALPVRAPLAGAVVQLRAALGQVVKAEDTLFEIHDLTGALVRAFASEQQLSAVRVGQRARVRFVADPGWVGEGIVVRSGQEFRNSDRTLSVWVRLQEPPPYPLRQNTLAGVTLIGAESEPVLAVPRAAVWPEGTLEYLFVRKSNGTFERRRVQTGRSDDLLAEITGGLENGEVVAVHGVAELQTAYASLR